MTGARRLLAAVVIFVMASLVAIPAQSPASLRGAGATFPSPIYAKWFASYARRDPGVAIAYDAVGSEAGIRRLLAGEVDFGASDHPEILRELAPDKAADYLLFPSVVGAVVPIVNLPGVAGDIDFTPDVLAGIYLGTITKWNDPMVRQANRGLRLPDLDIAVIHRADGSGTSYTWTDYLSKASALWRARVGAGLIPNWPTGRAASGNQGMARLVTEVPGSIGYVEFIYAVQAHLSYARVRNRHGEFVSASLESIAAAASESAAAGHELTASIVDSPGAGAYPIAAFTWLVVPARIADESKRAALTDFLKWMLSSGQRQAAALGYVALPGDLAARAGTAIAQIR